MKLWEKLKDYVFQLARREDADRQREFIRSLRLSAPRSWSSRKDRKLHDWCESFMARNGGIVPVVSPESIYLKTRKPRARR